MMHSALADLLAAWLPRQRWFAGASTGPIAVEIVSNVPLAPGDPELRHLLFAVRAAGEQVTYQVLLGCREHLPDTLAPGRIGTLSDGRTCYDAVYDAELTAAVLAGIAANRVAGPLTFAAEPGAVIDPGATARLLPQTHSNTSIVFGDQVILKLLRRPYGGHHPDLEVPAALARAGSRLVAAPLGWLEARPEATGGAASEPAVLAILSEYFRNAQDGWTLATASVGAAGRSFASQHAGGKHADDQDTGHHDTGHHDSTGQDFAGQARLLGQATAQMHAEMAAAFGTASLSRADLAEMAAALTADLDRALRLVPGLSAHANAIRACYADLAGLPGDVPVQRIHGDYHLAQVLRTEHGWVVLDFEGEPSVPLATRRALAPAQRDVVGMLRSFDYAGRHQVLRRPGEREFERAALQWVRRCQDAFTDGYRAEAADSADSAGPLLRALTFQKAVYEAVYEARHRPDWLPIPLAAIAEAGT